MKQALRSGTAFALLITGSWLFIWPGASQKAQAIVLQPDERSIIASGKTLYQTHCASCHGVKLEGQPNWKERLPNGRLPAPPHDKTGHTWHHNDNLLFKITKFGTKSLAGPDYQTDMRGFAGELGDREIIAILSYIKSTWPKMIQKRHNAMNGSSQR